MSYSNWQKYEEIFPQIADLPEAVREARLAELCAGDEELRREILALLKADEKAAEFIESPIALPDSLSRVFRTVQTENPAADVLENRQFGAYRVVKKIGEGGMGAIYLAERADGEFRKKAAIKIVRHDAAHTAFNLRRFRHERQILAALEHQNIARLLDGGTTDDGLPFLVMEYVEGKSLFDFCNGREMDLHERLAVFRQICAAVEYAHAAGIIHRDIKPGNLLVTEDGTVKLLDFGIAKILDADFVGESIEQTATLMRQMTPEYASPEQIKGEKITPASDIYSLGVVLYELLTGTRPYKFSSRAPHEIARVICEQPVQSPKFGIQTEMSDDLKFIVLKALQKKPSERYASALDFDRDIERFLNGLPILTENTRLQFYRKTALESPDSSAVSLAIAPFQILPSGNPETSGADDSVNDFLGFGLADALTIKLSGIRQIAVRPTSSVFRAAAENKGAMAIGRELAVDYVLEGHILRVGEQIRVSVQLQKIRDDSVLWAGQFDEANADVFRLQDSISARVAESLVPQLTVEEQEILRRHGTTDAAAYEAYLRGRVSYHTYTFDGIAASEKYFKESIARDPHFALAHSGLADFYNWQTIAGLVPNREGFAKAKESARKAIDIDANLSEAHASLAFAKWAYDWDFAEAERLFQKSIRLNPNNTKAHEWYSYLLGSSERHDEAVEEMRRAERLDPNSPSVAAMFGFCLFNAGRYEEAYAKTRRALELEPDYYLALQGLGWVCPPLGKYEEGISGCRRAVRVSEQFSFNQLSLGLALIAAGQREEAREIAREIETLQREKNIPAYYPALIRAALGEDVSALRWLDKAIEERGYWTLWMRVEPRFGGLRNDPRFVERLAKIKPLKNAETTGNIFSPETERSGTYFQSYYSRFIKDGKVLTAAVLICLTLFAVAANYKFTRSNATPATEVALPDDPPREAEKPGTKDAVAADLYLAGKKQMETRTPGGITKAIEFFSEAAKRDANFVQAFSGLADAHLLIAGQRKNPADDYRKAEEYAVQALTLDPDSAEARISLGMAKFKNTGDFAAAEKHFRRAIEINPAMAKAHHWYSVILSEAGKFDDALREIKIAAELEPRSAVIQLTVGELYLTAKRYDEADFYFDKTIEIDKAFQAAYHRKSVLQQFRGEYELALETYRKARIYKGNDENEPLWLLMQAQAHAAGGRRAESLATLDRYFTSEINQQHPENFAIEVALVYHLLGESERVFEWLGKLKIKAVKDINPLLEDPRFAKLHADARFAALIDGWRRKLLKL